MTNRDDYLVAADWAEEHGFVSVALLLRHNAEMMEPGVEYTDEAWVWYWDTEESETSTERSSSESSESSSLTESEESESLPRAYPKPRPWFGVF